MHTLEIAVIIIGSTFLTSLAICVTSIAIYKTFRTQIDAVINHILNEQK